MASKPALQGTGLIRVLIGGALLIEPERSLRSMGLDAEAAARSVFLARMVGARDAALGAGLVHAARRGSDPRPWLIAQAVSDAVDFTAFVDARRRGVMSTRHTLTSAFAAATGIVAEVGTLRALHRR